MRPAIHLDFPHSWTVQILDQPPLITPARRFIYPREAEEVERGALVLDVRPPASGNFLAVCALGFADEAVPTGVWSCPAPDLVCAAAGGYVYLIDAVQPKRWQQVAYRPVLEIRALPEENLLLFAGHHAITAWGPDGEAWQTARLSWEGLQILGVENSILTGYGWDLMADREVPFAVDLKTGEHQGGAAPK